MVYAVSDWYSFDYKGISIAQVGALKKQTEMALLLSGKKVVSTAETAFFNILSRIFFHGADTVKTTKRQDLHNYLLNYT